MRTVLRALAALCLLLPVALVVAPVAEAASDNRPTFIVTLRFGEPRAIAAEHARRHGADVTFVYEHALRGYAAKVSEGQIGALARDSRVERIERDGPVQASGEQTGATWGLDRIDQRDLPMTSSYSWNADGTGVTAYIIDTGVRVSHADFEGRASDGHDFVSNDPVAEDCNGHGTHVAGTVGGKTYGVAKNVRLVGVRVLDCKGSGTWAGVIAGVDWVTAQKKAAPTAPALANMSLGGGANSSVDAAVSNSIAAGVSYAVAAGNDNANACNYSPARVTDAMTIGATTTTDARATYSNHGSCIDWFAPGSGITSAWYTTDTATNTIGGTSMASPHAAGAAALFLQTTPGASPAMVRTALFDLTTKGKVTSASSTNNHLLYSLDIKVTAPPPTSDNVVPTAAFTVSCSSLTCDFVDGSWDADGTVASRSWSFGDGSTSTDTNPSRTYAASGSYTVTLTVTDNGGATGTTSQSVTVTAPTGGIALTVLGYKVSGVQRADLTWSGATGTDVDVFRNSVKILTTPNDGLHTDNINKRGGGSYTYRVCNAGSTACSPNVTITF